MKYLPEGTLGQTRFGLLGNFPNIREVPRVFAEGEWYSEVHGAGNNEKNTEQDKSKNSNKNKAKTYISYDRLKFWLTFQTTLKLSVSL